MIVPFYPADLFLASQLGRKGTDQNVNFSFLAAEPINVLWFLTECLTWTVICDFDHTIGFLDCKNKKIWSLPVSSSQVKIPKEQIIFPTGTIFQRNRYFEEQFIECVCCLLFVFRYIAICRPRHSIPPAWIFISLLLIWSIPAVLQLPWLIYNTTDYFPNGNFNRVLVCYARFPGFPKNVNFSRWFFTCVMFFTLYITPLILIIVCYSLVGRRVWQRSMKGLRGTRVERNIQKSKISFIFFLQ